MICGTASLYEDVSFRENRSTNRTRCFRFAIGASIPLKPFQNLTKNFAVLLILTAYKDPRLFAVVFSSLADIVLLECLLRLTAIDCTTGLLLFVLLARKTSTHPRNQKRNLMSDRH